jgi:hypothetical protein
VAFEKMRLVGELDVSEAARSWVRAVYAMRDALNDETSLIKKRWDGLVSAANKMRDAFHQAARLDLAIEGSGTGNPLRRAVSGPGG